MIKRVHYLTPLLAMLAAMILPNLVFAESAKEAYLIGDHAAAFSKWQIEAKKGNADAQFNLAFMYENGQGVKQDLFAAAKWYELAAGQNYPTSQTMLIAARKKIQFKNEHALLNWLPQAEAGDAKSQLAVSKILSSDKQASQDNVEALKWLLLAEEGTISTTFRSRIQRYKAALEARLSADEINDAINRVENWKRLRVLVQ